MKQTALQSPSYSILLFCSVCISIFYALIPLLTRYTTFGLNLMLAAGQPPPVDSLNHKVFFESLISLIPLGLLGALFSISNGVETIFLALLARERGINHISIFLYCIKRLNLTNKLCQIQSFSSRQPLNTSVIIITHCKAPDPSTYRPSGVVVLAYITPLLPRQYHFPLIACQPVSMAPLGSR